MKSRFSNNRQRSFGLLILVWRFLLKQFLYCVYVSEILHDYARRLKKQKNQSDEKLLHGVKQFNLDPKRGLDFLSKSGYLNRDSPKEVADFLFREGRLKKNQIGAVLGGHKDFNKQVLSEYVGLHEFTHLILVTALRQFLWSFR